MIDNLLDRIATLEAQNQQLHDQYLGDLRRISYLVSKAKAASFGVDRAIALDVAQHQIILLIDKHLKGSGE